MVTAREVRDLLDERPDLEPPIEAVLDAEPPWAFHDVDVDSGRFGELVARGVVEETDDGYRVADHDAVARGLAGEVDTDPEAPGLTFLDVSISRLEVGAVLGALSLVVGFRLVALPNVYVDGQVVLSGNDPYFYRYLVEQLLTSPDVTPSSLGFDIARGEPLFVVTLWLVTLALGGSLGTAGHVLAWYPVVTAVLTALLVYGTAVLVTDDRRIGLAAVLMLAVLPGHALRTSLGFADHHAFDYLWMALTLFALIVLIRLARRQDELASPGTLAATATLTIGITAQTLAWDNSPLILAALGPYLALETLRAVYGDESPVRTVGPVLVGVVIAAGFVWTAHIRLGWHTELVASAPLLLAIGGLAVLAVGEVAYRYDRSVIAVVVVEAVGLLVGTYALSAIRPEYWNALVSRSQRKLLGPQVYAGGQSIFSDSGGWLLLFGFILLIALPYLVWASYRAIGDARWLPPVVYGWYFFGLTSLQARFVGELAPALVLFAGLALVHLAERIDIARRPAPFTDTDPPDLRLPDTRQAGYLVLLFLLVGGLSVVQVPVKTSQVMTPPGLSATAFYLADHSDERSLEYPENYVFSEWDKNRVYNYFVSGESRSYGYARQHFEAFIRSDDPATWYDRLRNRGYVVTTPDSIDEPGQIGTRLHAYHGSRTESSPGLAHFRLVFASANGRYKAFAIIPGAVIEGTAPPNTTVTAQTEVSVPGASFIYERRTTAGPDGNFSIEVAYPGSYRVADGLVVVNDTAVMEGHVVELEAGESRV